MPTYQLTLCLYILSFFTSLACASAIDCRKAGSVVERSICGSEHGYLVREDKKLDRAYTKLMDALPETEKSKLFGEQRNWLLQRDRCQADHSCLFERYQERRKAIMAQWEKLNAHKPDDIDLEALSQFRIAIEQNMLTDKEFASEKAIEKFSLSKEKVSIGRYCLTDFPMERPKNVSSEEWAAFSTLSKYYASANLDCPQFFWLDVDQDGQRDLLVRTYGGNGYSEAVLKRTGRSLGDVDHILDALWFRDDSREIFGWACKGCDEDTEWVRINGRTYLAHRNGRFGMNEVFLLSPFRINFQAPRVVVKYSYSLKVGLYTPEMFPDSPEEYKSAIKKQQSLLAGNQQFLKLLQSAMTKSLEHQNRTPPMEALQKSSPICPIPEGTPKEERSKYMQYGETYYAFEAVTDFAIWINKQCHIGRLLHNLFYSKKEGVSATLLVRRTDAELEDSASFVVIGRRKAVSIDSGLAAPLR